MKTLSTPSRFIALIIGGLFVSELIAMGIISSLNFLSYSRLSFIDATLMILLATPLLYFFSLRPLIKATSEREAEIAQREQTEVQLRIQTTALETAANGVIITDKQGKILWANQAFAQMTGYSIDEVLGKTPEFLKSGVHDSDFYRELWETILLGNVWHGEMTNRRKDGTHYIDEQTITPVFNSSGEIENFIAIQQDVTDRKRGEAALRESEQKFRTFVDWTYDWEKWLDPQGNVLYTSPSCERITGFRPEDFIADPHLLVRIVHPDDRLFYEKHQQVVHNESIGPLNVEYRIIDRDGVEHWIEHVCRPLFGNDNIYMGRRVSNRDITKRKQAEKDIRERDRKASLLSQTIHTMQIDIARDLHDTVGQNISYLRMKLDHMLEKGLIAGPDIAQDIKRMSEVANESYDLMRGTLAVLQLEDSADLSRLFSRYAAQIEERSTFKVEFSSQGESRPLSAQRMRQLFYIYREILNNIEKHANASKASIEVAWRDDHLSLIVFDDGCGFDPVNTVPQSGRYGLKFMRERVELLDGTIVVNSVAGAGTHIELQVPLEYD